MKNNNNLLIYLPSSHRVFLKHISQDGTLSHLFFLTHVATAVPSSTHCHALPLPCLINLKRPMRQLWHISEFCHILQFLLSINTASASFPWKIYFHLNSSSDLIFLEAFPFHQKESWWDILFLRGFTCLHLYVLILTSINPLNSVEIDH